MCCCGAPGWVSSPSRGCGMATGSRRWRPLWAMRSAGASRGSPLRPRRGAGSWRPTGWIRARCPPLSMRASMALSDEHLAELHQRARELNVPRYRMLPRDELIEAIEEGGDSDEPREPAAREEASESGGDRPRGRGRRGAPRKPKREEGETPKPDDEQGEEPEGEEPEAEAETEEITGVLDRMPQGYGFLRLSGMSEAEGDVYVSASQIRRCELRPGDQVSGPARQPRRDERHRALVRVEAVNGQSPEGERKHFEDLTAAPPSRRLLAPDAPGAPLVRAVDLLGPLAFGQRVLVLAQPRSGRTTLLRALGAAIAETGAHLV